MTSEVSSTADQIIKVINDLCDKLGVAVNWSSDQFTNNLIPLVQTFIHKYQIYLVVSNFILSGIGILCICLSLKFGLKVLSDYGKDKNNIEVSSPYLNGSYDCDINAFGITVLIISIFVLITGLIMTPFGLVGLVKSATFPELSLLEKIMSLMGK